MNDYEAKTEILLRARADGAARRAEARPQLVTTDWLERRLGDPRVVVLDVSAECDFARPRVPGALPLDWRGELMDQDGRELVDRERLEQILQSAGVRQDGAVVVYGDCNNWFAAFAFWTLDHYGAPDVRLLDGGAAAWRAEGRPLAVRAPHPPLGDVRLREPAPEGRARLQDVLDAVARRTDAVLVDVRSPGEYQGRIRPLDDGRLARARPGHVPGAINVPWGELVDADGTFKPTPALRAAFAKRGVDGRRPIITYCSIGERSSHTWFALTRLLGFEARNYVGSWIEYGNAPEAPVANPSAA